MRPPNTKRINRLHQQIVATHHCLPSLNELATWSNLPLSTAHYYLGQLEEDGLVVVGNRRRERNNGGRLNIKPVIV